MRNIIVTPDGTHTSFKYPDDREVLVGTLIDLFIVRDDIEVKVCHYVSRIHKTSNSVLYHVEPYIEQSSTHPH